MKVYSLIVTTVQIGKSLQQDLNHLISENFYLTSWLFTIQSSHEDAEIASQHRKCVGMKCEDAEYKFLEVDQSTYKQEKMNLSSFSLIFV